MHSLATRTRHRQLYRLSNEGEYNYLYVKSSTKCVLVYYFIKYLFKSGGIFGGDDYVEVQRYKPDNHDYAKPDIVATFIPHKKSSVHSFAVTESYAVFLYPALTYDTGLGCLMSNGFHVNECMLFLEDEPTDIFIVNMKTGEVQEIQVKSNILISKAPELTDSDFQFVSRQHLNFEIKGNAHQLELLLLLFTFNMNLG